MDINQHKLSSAFDQRDVLTSLRAGGAFSFPSSQSQGTNSSSSFKPKRGDGLDDFDPELLQLPNYTPFKNQQHSSATMSPSQANMFSQSGLSFPMLGSSSGTMSSQSATSTQNSRSQSSTFGGNNIPNVGQQQRLTSPVNSGGTGGNSFMQSLMFQQQQQQPPTVSSPSRMFRQPLPITSIGGGGSTGTGSSSNLNSINATAAMVASLQQQQQQHQQQQQQRIAFGQTLFGSGNNPTSNSGSSNISQSSAIGGNIRRPPTAGSSGLLMDPSEFPVLASGTSGQGSGSTSQSGPSRLLTTTSGGNGSGASGGSNLGIGSSSAFSGFTPQSAAAVFNRFASSGMSPAALGHFLAGIQQQQQQQQHYTSQLAMAAAAAAMASQSQNSGGSDSGGMSQTPQPAFRMDEDDFPALKSVTGSTSSSQNMQGSGGLIGSGTQSRSGAANEQISGANNEQGQTSLSNSTLSAFSTVEQSLNRMSALGSGRSSTQLQSSGNAGSVTVQHSQSSSGLVPSIGKGSTSPSGSGNGILVDSDGSVSNIPVGLVADAFGLVGLLSFMKTAPSATLDPASSAIAVGLALTELGLRLNAPEPLHTSFASPWHDAAGSKPHDMDCPVPPEYLVSQQQQQLAAMRDPASGSSLGGFGNRALQQQQQLQLLPSAALRTSHEDLLFFLFYTCPGDALQLAAAAELIRRNWRYHRLEAVWLTRVDGPSQQSQEFESGTFEVFDFRNWKRERREQRVEYKDIDPTELFQFIQQQQMSSSSSNLPNTGANAGPSSFNAPGGPPVAPAVSGANVGSASLLSRNAF